jgi:perosamine synthetase
MQWGVMAIPTEPLAPIRWEDPAYGDREQEYVVRALTDPSFKPIEALESTLADWLGGARVVTCSNGTVAILLALQLHDIGPGDEVAVPTYTFASVVNPIILLGARPLLLDSSPDTGNVDMDALEEHLRAGRRIRARLHVDVGGVPPDYDRLARLTRDHGLIVVEDGAESLGSEVRGQRVGNSPHVATLSFQTAKQLSAAEGGAVTVPDDALAKRCRRLRNHGMSGRYEHTDFGLNLRISTLNAALGLAQAERLDGFIATRERIVATYRSRLSDILTFQPIPEWATRVSWGMCMVRARDTETRDAIVQGLAGEGIETRVNWKPVHRQPYQRYLADGTYPVAEDIHATSLTLPLGNGMTDETIDRVAGAVRRAVGA